jgi:hypothetical protein
VSALPCGATTSIYFIVTIYFLGFQNQLATTVAQFAEEFTASMHHCPT